ncbi:MAG: hypothetical protein ACRDQI_20785, partial [Pseudonocardiaceae bacterium]
ERESPPAMCLAAVSPVAVAPVVPIVVAPVPVVVVVVTPAVLVPAPIVIAVVIAAKAEDFRDPHIRPFFSLLGDITVVIVAPR